MAETPAERAKARALRLLEKRDYSEAELAAKLVEKGDDPDSARAAAARMAELGFVNDENYAAMVVRHYAAKGYGRARIREELRRRKLPRELWDAALDELEDCLAGGGSVEEAYDAKELSEAINAFLSSLSYTDRFLFVRRYWYSDSMQDIAAMIGSTANSVAVRLYRLREKLRHYLIREGLLV